VLVGGRKVIGSAQLRTRTAFLQHGSVLLEGDQRLVAEVSMHPGAQGSEGSLRSLLGRRVGFEELAEEIAAAAHRWGGDWRMVHRGDVIVERAAAAADSYRSDAWSWER
jgi:lipoate-protein ligase A